MLIVKLNNGDSIEKALKIFKNKFRKTKVTEQLRENQYYSKPSEEKRVNIKKAIYKQKKENQSED